METNGYTLDSLSNFIDVALSRFVARHDRPERQKPSPETALPPEVDTVAAEGWAQAEAIYNEGASAQSIVTGWNRGGLLVRWNGLQGFVPVSQLRKIPVFESELARDEQLARWVGEELRLRVIELDRGRNRLVFSERATLWDPDEGKRILDQIKAGETHEGRISNLCDFGAFVDLGGIDGLIHISELSWGRVTHPRELLSLGQQVEAFVLSVDRDQRRIALSLKRLQPNPWTLVEQNRKVGQIIPATITNIVEFGAFAQIEEGLEGLIHISELGHADASHPAEVVSVGDKVLVRILRIDSEGHRLGLSMNKADKAATGDQEDASDSGWEEGRTYLY